MKLASLASLIALAAAPAAAQPITQPSQVAAAPALGVEVLAPDGALDGPAVRAALAAELAVEITDATAFAPSLGRLEIAAAEGELSIAYHPTAGTVIERTLALPVAPEERVQLVAYVAANLVRDQAGEILADLAPPAPAVIIPPPAPPPRAPLAPPTRRVAATLGFVPPLALDRALGERVVVGFGLHVLVGMTTGSEVASISGLVDVQRERARGVQLAGIAAAAGRLEGVQIGGVAALADGRAGGIQIGGIAASARAVHGAQLGGVAVHARGRVDGLQLAGAGTVAERDTSGAQVGGVVAATRGALEGVQVGGVLAAATRVRGVQLAGVAALAPTRVDGLQIGGAAAIAPGRVEGLQIGGAVTYGGDVHGMQVGVVNVAGRMRGVQLGVVNLSNESADAIPIGLINYARDGRLAAESWVETSQLSAVAVRHGTRRIHNVWGVGWAPDHGHALVGAGLGVHLPLTGAAVDLDAMHWLTNVWDGELGQLAQARASVAVPLGAVELFGGVAANVYVADGMDESAGFHPVLARRTTTSGGDAVVGWPSAFAGVRLRAR